MTIERTIKIEKKVLDEYERLLKLKEVNPADHGYSRFERQQTWTAVFPYGYTMDLNLCTSGTDFWTECMLFDRDNHECGCTDVMDYLAGDWKIEHEGNTFVLNVAADE